MYSPCGGDVLKDVERGGSEAALSEAAPGPAGTAWLGWKHQGPQLGYPGEIIKRESVGIIAKMPQEKWYSCP